MRIFSQFVSDSIIFSAVVLLLCGCMSSGKYTKEAFPRADQKRWPDETEVVDVVVRCVRMAEYTSGRPHAIREYAIFLRSTYSRCSEGGIDIDAGVRALNYIRKIHRDARGGRKLWRQAIELAQYEPENTEKRMPGLPPPHR